MNDICAMVMFHDNIEEINGNYYLSTYNKDIKRKALYLIEEEDVKDYGIDYDLLFAEEETDGWEVPEGFDESFYDTNLVNFYSLARDKYFRQRIIANKVASYYVYTMDNGNAYTIINDTKIWLN